MDSQISSRLAVLGLAILFASSAMGGPVELRVQTPCPLPTDEATLVVEGGNRSDHRIDLLATRRWTIPTVDGRLPSLRVSTPGLWSETEVSRDGVGTLRIWPSTRLLATAKPADDEAAPNPLRARLHLSPPDDRFASPGAGGACLGPARASVRCVFSPGLDCEVPAGRWNVRIEPEGFAPVFAWAVEAPAGTDVRLPTVALRRGGTVFGRLSLESGELVDLSETEVSLLPTTEGDQLAPRRARRRSAQAWTRQATPWGDFAFEGVGPGRYVVRATHPAHGTGEFEMDLPPEEILDLTGMIRLAPLSRLTVTVRPAVDPRGEPWSLRLIERTGPTEMKTVAEGSTDRGEWRAPPVESGDYRIRVSDRTGRDRLAHREILLAGGEENLEILLDLVRVEGTVLLDEEAVPSTVVLTRSGMQIDLRAPGGQFAGFLPEEGEWIAEVRAPASHVASSDLRVEVAADSDRYARVDIELPETEIEGVVRNEFGEPFAGALVTFFPLSDGAGIREVAEDDGGFRFRGMPPGRYRLKASSDADESEALELDLEEGTSSLGHELVIREGQLLRGRLVGDSRADIRVLALSSGAGIWASSREEVYTDVTGGFEIEVPAGALETQLTVFSPEHSFLATTLGLPASEEEIAISPIREGGTLILPPDRIAQEGRSSVLWIGGELVAGPILQEWTILVGGQLDDPWVVPKVPPGEVRHCSLSIEEAFAVMSRSALPREDVCRTGFLSAGGRLDLTE